MRKRKDSGKQEGMEKILDVNASMQGTLRFDDPVNLRINGKFEGTLTTKGVLMVGEKADIVADITGESILIAGTVKGNIVANRNLVLEPTAHLEGDVIAPLLMVEEGAVLNGCMSMTKKAAKGNFSRGDWMTVEQLSKYLEVEMNKVTEWANGGKLPCTKEGGEWVFERTKVDQWIAEGKVKE